ncbi:MAG TPA: alkaline phosphatase [Firmicutes bacterium]|jgi:alkaline phosphatase|nr:alkaline phosphatase [Bacillota bacterium]HHT43519.1 alkaline phosphatase [Bacillota bacterium]
MKTISKQLWRSMVFTLILAVLWTAGAAAETPVKNVILLIGDGMGINHITAARLSLAEGAYSVLNLDTMPYTGFSLNFADNNLVTDSAAAATALATGFRTETGRLATLPDGTPLESIMLRAKAEGLSTGIVSTVKITDATPAAFLVNADSRTFERDVAAAILETETDVFLGGGADAFGINPFTKQPKSNALIHRALEKGYTFVSDREGLLNLEITPGLKLIGLFIGGDMSFELTRLPTEPSLMEMTERALEVVSQNPRGFFLMVEGARIDRASHTQSAKEMVGELLMFDQVVGLALEFAKDNPGTLVVVTADHETGGLAITSGHPSGETVNYHWASTGHTAAVVPIYAYGPGAERFSGTLPITEIPVRIAELMGLTGFPAAKEMEE